MSMQDSKFLALALSVGWLVAIILALGEMDWGYAILFSLLFLATLQWIRVLHRRETLQVFREEKSATRTTAESVARLQFIASEKRLSLSYLPDGLDVTAGYDRPRGLRSERAGECSQELRCSITVTARNDATIVEFGAFVSCEDSIFKPATWLPFRFSAEDFADWYSCKRAKLLAGKAYSCAWPWTGDHEKNGNTIKWYFIAVTADGLRVKGEAAVELHRPVQPAQASRLVNAKSSEGEGPENVGSHKAGEIFRDRIVDECGNILGEGPEMVVVPAGRFLLGSPGSEAGRLESEGPQEEVTISKPFAIGATLVTVGQYKLYLKYRKSLPDRFFDEQDLARESMYYMNGEQMMLTRAQAMRYYEARELLLPARPALRRLVAQRYQQADHFAVHYMNWFDAKAYAAWLSEYTGQRYRLPSEAEWEYAMRAETSSAFFWGETMPAELSDMINASQHARYPDGLAGRKRRGFPPEKYFPPNQWGIYRNYLFREWCEDAWHENHIGAPGNGEARMPSSRCPSGSEYTERVQRYGVRTASRWYDGGCFRSAYRGFRVVREIE